MSVFKLLRKSALQHRTVVVSGRSRLLESRSVLSTCVISKDIRQSSWTRNWSHINKCPHLSGVQRGLLRGICQAPRIEQHLASIKIDGICNSSVSGMHVREEMVSVIVRLQVKGCSQTTVEGVEAIKNVNRNAGSKPTRAMLRRCFEAHVLRVSIHPTEYRRIKIPQFLLSG